MGSVLPDGHEPPVQEVLDLNERECGLSGGILAAANNGWSRVAGEVLGESGVDSGEEPLDVGFVFVIPNSGLDRLSGGFCYPESWLSSLCLAGFVRPYSG